jgi:hypothetical protein
MKMKANSGTSKEEWKKERKTEIGQRAKENKKER